MSIDKKSNYYDAGGIESIDIIKAKSTAQQFIGFLNGNIMKYSTRMSFKTALPDRDAEKILTYSTALVEFLKSLNESEKENPIPGKYSTYEKLNIEISQLKDEILVLIAENNTLSQEDD